MEEVEMTFLVEPELRDRFAKAAELDHRPASQVLRDLMRGYVQARALEKGASAPPLIDAAEQRRRREAFAFARASISLEGFVLSKEAEELTRRFVDGEIEMAEFLSTR